MITQKVSGSSGSTPNKRLFIKRVKAKAALKPFAIGA
jgi:hypothetical protein